ncbi:leukotriene B4 receptor 1 isoform X2 [Stigmatopora argus]
MRLALSVSQRPQNTPARPPTVRNLPIAATRRTSVRSARVTLFSCHWKTSVRAPRAKPVLPKRHVWRLFYAVHVRLAVPCAEGAEVEVDARDPAEEAMASDSPAPRLPLDASARVGVAILTLAFVLGFPGNLFVVWSAACRVRKRSVTCLLVLNLAAADAGVLLTAPVFLRYLAGGRGWEFGSAACKLVHYLSNVNMMRTKRSLLIVLLAVWAAAFLLALPMPFYRSHLRKVYPDNTTLAFCVPYHWRIVGHRVFQYALETVMGCLLPFALINTCYSSIICRLRSAMFQRRAKGNRLILAIVCTFALFWLPYHVVNVVEVIGLLRGSPTAEAAALRARPNVTALAYFSSAVNPILYVFAGSSHIRRAGLGFMAKLFEATNSESRSSAMSRGGHAAGSSPGGTSVLRMPLSIKLKKPFGSGRSGHAHAVGGEGEMDEAELKSLASVDP